MNASDTKKKKSNILSKMRFLRAHFFGYIGQKRLLRILFIALITSTIWIFADILSNSYEPKFRDDLIVLVFAIVFERLLPWGKGGNIDTDTYAKLIECQSKYVASMKREQALLVENKALKTAKKTTNRN